MESHLPDERLERPFCMKIHESGCNPFSYTPKAVSLIDDLFCSGLAIFNGKVSRKPKPKAVFCDNFEVT